VWAIASKEQRREKALALLRAADLEGLHALLAHHMRTWGRAGARVSPHTLKSYKSALRAFLGWLVGMGLEGEALVEAIANPSEELGAAFLRHLEEEGLRPASVNQRRAALGALYEALRWAGVTQANPFREAPTRRDPVPRWEKRRPYSEDEVKRLLEAAATPEERLLLLLGAQGGLRVSEAVGLRWEDVDLEGRTMRVYGKGRKEATVLLPGPLLEALKVVAQPTGKVLPWKDPEGARRALKRLAKRAGVPYRGYHALRHYCGTHLYRATGDLQTVARHLRHSNIQVSTIYAKWGEEEARKVLEAWG
jgi:integrase/recombinase XerC